MSKMEKDILISESVSDVEVNSIDLGSAENLTEHDERAKSDSEPDTRLRLLSVALILPMIFVCGGVFGFVYEELFYRIDLGYFVKRGTTFGPWIPIYGFGALLILLCTYRLNKRPWLVFAVGGTVCGILEFTTGYFLFHGGNIRLWDYNNEIWNWGNIGGYTCLRSVMFFALSSIILMYGVLPFVRYLFSKLPRPLFGLTSVSLGLLFLLDVIVANAF